MIDRPFWRGRRVFLTGHTGFKGSWLSLWLHTLGADITGYALDPPTDPSLYLLCGIDGLLTSTIADIRDRERLRSALLEVQPEIVIHMAAQPLVRDGYRFPVETFEVNVMGTVHLLEAVRACSSVRAFINVTTDKCYENHELARGYREDDPLGGYDPYSSSKACSELVTAAYRSSYFGPDVFLGDGPTEGNASRARGTGTRNLACGQVSEAANRDWRCVGLASARAGNAIGGGDWATDRLVPDVIRALLRGKEVVLRNPDAVRPWQHVLEPLGGYLLLAQNLFKDPARYAGAWNFGPDATDSRSVVWVVEELCRRWGGEARYRCERGEHPHETGELRLDSAKARAELGWRPRWDLTRALDAVVEWTREYAENRLVAGVCFEQIRAYEEVRAG